MKLFLISQNENIGYETYDSAVVAAPDAEIARCMHPCHGEMQNFKNSTTWCSDRKHVQVEYLGEAADGILEGVICASFNAG